MARLWLELDPPWSSWASPRHSSEQLGDGQTGDLPYGDSTQGFQGLSCALSWGNFCPSCCPYASLLVSPTSGLPSQPTLSPSPTTSLPPSSLSPAPLLLLCIIFHFQCPLFFFSSPYGASPSLPGAGAVLNKLGKALSLGDCT